MPGGGSSSESSSVPITTTRCEISPRARAAANAATSSGPLLGVASVTAVTPSAARRRETSARLGGASGPMRSRSQASQR